MGEVIFWGATGQAKVLREALYGTGIDLVALFDRRDIPSPFRDVPLFVGETGFETWLAGRGDLSDVSFCVAIAGNLARDRLAVHDYLQANGLRPLTVVHRAAFVANDSSLGEGCQILARSAIGACARLGRCVIVNTAASVDHDCVLDDGVHIGPGAVLAGEITVGAGAFIGAGAVILPRLCVGEDAIVGAGSVVTKDVQCGEVVVGSPARSIRRSR
jgi:sugar O-acyltransferase (sialic acid O-acetyltransferase NeuD family)